MFGISRTRRQSIAIFDIESGSVAAAIVERGDEAAAEVVVCERASAALEDREPEHLIATLSDILQQVGARALEKYSLARPGARSPQDAWAIIRAPWARSNVLRASSGTPKEERITDEILARLAKEARAKDEPLSEQFLSTEVTNVFLNGYSTNRPEGESAHLAEVVVLACASHPRMRSSVCDVLAHLLPNASVKLRSGTRALFEIAGLVERSEGSDCLVAEVDGEGTSIIVMRDGVITEQGFVSEGIRSILERVSSGNAQEALSLVRMVGRDECESDACKKLEEAFARAEPEVARAFGEAFVKIAEPQRLPNRLLLATSPDLASWLSQFFSRVDFAQFTTTMQPFEVAPLEARALSSRVRFSPQVTPDAGVLTASSLINTP